MAEQLKKAIEAIANSKEDLEVLNPNAGDELAGGLLDNGCTCKKGTLIIKNAPEE
jgi:hypothetical protein